jgi:hypothetical protein
MNALKKELAYGAAYNVFYNANRQDRNGLNESQINLLNWLEPSMADAYAQIMIKTKGNQKVSLDFVYKLYAVENLQNIFAGLNDGKSIDDIVGLVNF